MCGLSYTLQVDALEREALAFAAAAATQGVRPWTILVEAREAFDAWLTGDETAELNDTQVMKRVLGLKGG